MLKRMVIELIVVFSLLLVCMLYGAVTVRDAQNPETGANAVPAITVPHQENQQQSIAQNQSPTASDTVHGAGNANGAGQSFSDHISRFFLAGVSFIAGVFENIIQIFI